MMWRNTGSSPVDVTWMSRCSGSLQWFRVCSQETRGKRQHPKTQCISLQHLDVVKNRDRYTGTSHQKLLSCFRMSYVFPTAIDRFRPICRGLQKALEEAHEELHMLRTSAADHVTDKASYWPGGLFFESLRYVSTKQINTKHDPIRYDKHPYKYCDIYFEIT